MVVGAEVFAEVPPDDPRALELHRASRRVGAQALGIADSDPAGAAPGLDLSDGVLLLVMLGGEAVAIGGIRDLGGPVAEVKSMYVAPEARRRGIARRLLARLEGIAADRGCESVRLDSLAALEAACALYESVGYSRIPDYNDSPFADRWYGRRLD